MEYKRRGRRSHESGESMLRRPRFASTTAIFKGVVAAVIKAQPIWIIGYARIERTESILETTMQRKVDI